MSQNEIEALAQSAELVRMEALDTVVDDEQFHYWQAYLGPPVDSTIQVVGDDEDAARENLQTAAWDIMQARQESSAAAEEPVDPDENYDPPESG